MVIGRPAVIAVIAACTSGAVTFLMNDKVVKVLKKTELDGASTDGLVGMRLNHNLDVHISDFGVKK